MKFCTFTKNRKHRQKTQICNINRQSDDSLIWKLSTPSDCHTQETRRKYKDCKLLQLLYPTQFTWGGKVKSCQQRLTLKAKRSKFLWATVWDLSPSIRQLSSSSTSSSHSFSCCLLFIFPPVHFFFLEPCWPEVRKNLGGCVGRSHVVKDSPQPHCPLELGLMKTNSDLRRSSTKSIFVPIICMRARGSIKTFTPFSSTISSNLPRVSAAPNTACHSLVLFEYKQLLETGSGGGGGA
jgi:hypothetical protein